MPPTVRCPRCDGSRAGTAPADPCPRCGGQHTLRRADAAAYDTFVEHLATAGGLPTYLPWPLGPGWRVSDFAAVTDRHDRAVATLAAASGDTELDGPVDVLVVAEEAHVGLGGRCAGLPVTDPGQGFWYDPPSARIRVGHKPVSLWPVSTSGATGDLDRSVLVGEVAGRWLWLVLMPASAILLVRDDWILRDVSDLGPALVELPFGGPAPRW